MNSFIKAISAKLRARNKMKSSSDVVQSLVISVHSIEILVMATRTTLLLVRHGARFDYANSREWRERCTRHGHELTDPPLSALGQAQARETAAALVREKPNLILASPYFRVLQTAQPLAQSLGLRIGIEHCLAEFGHSPEKIVPPEARMPVLPEVDEEYVPVLDRLCRGQFDKLTGRETTVDYLRRLLLWKRELASGRFAGQTIACFSHAGSVALVGALVGAGTLEQAGKFAPCGIYKLISDDGGRTWTVAARGDDNSAHCTANDSTTRAWGFADLKSEDAFKKSEAAWLEALALGPTADAPAASTRVPARAGGARGKLVGTPSERAVVLVGCGFAIGMLATLLLGAGRRPAV
jgi:transcription factor C subunit 7